MSDSLDDLAAFLMHRSADEGRTDADRLAIYALVAAYQESYDPGQIDTLLRAAGARVAPVLEHLAASTRAPSPVNDPASNTDQP